ncbi:uncharacterized protein RAG0_02997 [Rhynchosporium agropyri]|uniref:Uncharacterized protein n=1 Tax=Rhynchosporium agropyri TaxID=914238 RepID=A0A1E1K313_9HELO|nr:uncharacterized protein RAG0_02997 [Rhynchosporium agropyri]
MVPTLIALRPSRSVSGCSLKSHYTSHHYPNYIRIYSHPRRYALPAQNKRSEFRFAVEVSLDLELAENLLPIIPEASQTDNRDYEIINEEHTFDAVNFDRYMLWKAGDGYIRMGIRTIKTDTDEKNMKLVEGWNIVVIKTNFKLVDRAQ